MKHWNTNYSNTLTVLALFFALAVGQQAQAQSAESTFNISAGDKLPDFMLAQLSGLDDAVYTAESTQGQSAQGEGIELASRVFDTPGTHTIRFTRVHFPGQKPEEAQEKAKYMGFTKLKSVGESHVCDHYALPDQITVIVNPHRIEYLTETISFSQKIVGGQPTENITVSIQVNVTGDNVPMPTQFYSSGIETTITGQLNPQQSTLSTGTHTLQYQLQGMGKPGTYIQFNFQDANGHDVPCGITTPL